MENVRGALSAAVRHRLLKKRGPGFPPLAPEEELGSAFMLILEELKSTGYFVLFDLINAADYGVPQTRERVLFIGSRDGEPVEMPARTHDRNGENTLKPWVTLGEGLLGLRDTRPQHTSFSKSEQKYLSRIPEGGNWRDLPKHSQPRAIGSAYRSWGGRSGFLRRLSWRKPSPSLTTAPDGKATMMCHPDKVRPLSVRQYARIQQFPDHWKFAGGLPQKYRQIGNAVPVGIGKAIGGMLNKTIRENSQIHSLPTIICYNNDLLSRISQRPKTILNPQRMRRIKSREAALKWLEKSNGLRSEILRFSAQNPTQRNRI